jgi:hypothetical protein
MDDYKYLIGKGYHMLYIVVYGGGQIFKVIMS